MSLNVTHQIAVLPQCMWMCMHVDQYVKRWVWFDLLLVRRGILALKLLEGDLFISATAVQRNSISPHYGAFFFL